MSLVPIGGARCSLRVSISIHARADDGGFAPTGPTFWYRPVPTYGTHCRQGSSPDCRCPWCTRAPEGSTNPWHQRLHRPAQAAQDQDSFPEPDQLNLGIHFSHDLPYVEEPRGTLYACGTTLHELVAMSVGCGGGPRTIRHRSPSGQWLVAMRKLQTL